MNELELKLNLENLTDAERNQFTKLCEKANKPKSKVWKPSVADIYWFVNEDVLWREWCDISVDNFRFRNNNCFKTRKEAEFYREKILVQAELEHFALENNTEELNWNDDEQTKYHIHYDYVNRKFDYFLAYYCREIGVVYFTSSEIVRQAIKEIGEDRLKKYLFGIY